ncbi:MAG: uroporphyrinogen decarboxylase family protein [Saccharofermentanales bacterium]
MNTRERFVEVMKNFNTNVPSMKWEFRYWGETINNWYDSGLPKVNPAKIPDEITTISSSIYTTSWLSRNPFIKEGQFPNGYAITGGGLYWPTQGFALDNDVKDYFYMDPGQKLIDLNMFFYPMFKPEILEEDDKRLKYLDIDGVVRLYLKESATMASGWEWPIRDRKSWEKLKDERIDFTNIRERLPKNWDVKVKEYKNRDYPLGIGGYPLGFFGTLAHLISYDRLFLMYYDDPELVHDIIGTFTDLWIAIYEEVLAEVEVDHMQIWEDISFGSGCMLSEVTMREFMLPYYKKLTSFLKSHGVDLIFVDTDGDCMKIIPLFIEGGATGMFPFEANCGMDIVKVRKDFPTLAMMGGIPKAEIQKGRARIDQILEPVAEVLKTGGYIPFGDHLISPESDWEDFKYYRNKLNDMIDKAAL